MSDLVNRLRKLAERERPYGSLPDTLDEAAARIARLEAREKDLTLEGLALIGRIEKTREALAGTDIGSLPNDYPLERMAADRMARIAQLEAEVEEQVQWVKDLADLQIKAEARIAQLEAALRGIIGWLEDPEGGSHEEDMREASRIARAALEERT